ncbi:hypothetical protein TSAR_006039 [Trichomalopsis sarcophagae]|uniref:Uncharacterized protein n=1 Tax=Trichomalopsis sarcophagae TaxID=543379 RepID=A0A232FEH7_9HYME|nr:hypothetical protein TSAR_006039 [Trichomalopsis sarcophagae]
MSFICMLGIVFQLIILVTLSGTLVAFAAFSNLLVFTISIATPIFLLVIRHASKFLFYSVSLLLVRTRSVLKQIDCSWLVFPSEPNQATMVNERPSNEPIATT